MSKWLVTVTAGVVVSLGALLWFNSNNPEKKQLPSATQHASQNSNNTASSNQKGGSYEEYSEARLAETSDTRILFFHASWCPQCRALEADIKKQGVPTGITIFKVDYDKSQGLRRKYGVTLQTSVVKVDEKGNLISKFTPYQKPTLENALSNL
jgi:hypothetical protein